jgi:hypothetical protein
MSRLLGSKIAVFRQLWEIFSWVSSRRSFFSCERFWYRCLRLLHPTIGKWTTYTMKVTGAKPLKKGHKVDDIFFFAGPPGSKTARLMIDNVRLEDSGD